MPGRNDGLLFEKPVDAEGCDDISKLYLVQHNYNIKQLISYYK